MRIISQDEFNDVVREGLVLVDFFADWCGPCRMLAPELEKLQNMFEDKLTVVKVNVDNDPELARAFNVFSIPNLYLFKDGNIVENVMGFQQVNSLAALVSKHL